MSERLRSAAGTDRRRRAERGGRRAEALAVWLLRLKGYRIVAQRMRTPVGEIDIVARRGSVLALVEVKHRPDPESGMEAVTPRQQKRIRSAARWFLAARPEFAAFCLRFDVILSWRGWHLRHIPAAFAPDHDTIGLP
ncbi:MAG: YraN family protein [Rhodospirillales bacterium]